MEELYEQTKEFIKNNYSGALDKETFDILSIAIIAINCRLSDISVKGVMHFKEKLVNDVGKTEHELIHLLRFNGIIDDEINFKKSTKKMNQINSFLSKKN